MRPLAIALVSIALSQTSQAATLDVQAPYASIQSALDAATSGDVVLVAPGTYHEHLLLGSLQSGVKLHSLAGAASTIIDGGGTNFAIYMSNDGPGTEIVGFTIQNGIPGIRVEGSTPLISDCIIQDNAGSNGGGIAIIGSPAQIQRCVIQNNVAGSSGGGVGGPVSLFDSNFVSGNSAKQYGGAAISGTNLVISNNHFLSNTATLDNAGALGADGNTIVRNNEFSGNSARFRGGAIQADGYAVVENNSFVGNSAQQGAGAVYLAYGTSHALVQNNYFQDNTTSWLGGAIMCENNASPTIEGNVIVRNHSDAGGGGIAISYYTDPTVTQNTIVLNSSNNGGGVYIERNANPALQRNIISNSQSGGGLFLDATSVVSFQCNDVWGNSGYDFSGFPNPAGTQGNVSSDPLYCNFATLDFHLAGASLCAPAHSGACGLIGALDLGCDAPVRTQPMTWGGLKARYR